MDDEKREREKSRSARTEQSDPNWASNRRVRKLRRTVNASGEVKIRNSMKTDGLYAEFEYRVRRLALAGAGTNKGVGKGNGKRTRYKATIDTPAGEFVAEDSSAWGAVFAAFTRCFEEIERRYLKYNVIDKDMIVLR